MKKLLLACAALCLCASVYAQGTLTFNNSSGTKITNSVTSLAADNATVALYYSTDLGATRSGLSIVTTAMTNTLTGASAGLFIGGTRSIAGTTGGQNLLVQIRAWTGAYTSYEDAVANATGSTLVGESQLFQITAGGNGFPTASLLGAGKLNAFTLQPVPEPSSIALGLLGLGAIALFRRKK